MVQYRCLICAPPINNILFAVSGRQEDNDIDNGVVDAPSEADCEANIVAHWVIVRVHLGNDIGGRRQHHPPPE